MVGCGVEVGYDVEVDGMAVCVGDDGGDDDNMDTPNPNSTNCSNHSTNCYSDMDSSNNMESPSRSTSYTKAQP